MLQERRAEDSTSKALLIAEYTDNIRVPCLVEKEIFGAVKRVAAYIAISCWLTNYPERSLSRRLGAGNECRCSPSYGTKEIFAE